MSVPGRPTIYDVAERAGVSIATVSHVLNRPERVAPQTRARVLSAVDELEFVPKATAVSRARKGVGRIGVIAPFSSYPSYSTRLIGVMAELEGTATEIVVFDHSSVSQSTSPLLSALPATGRLDGLVIMGIPLDETVAGRLSSRNLPTVLVDATHPAFSSITVDDEGGGLAIGRHLIETGRRSIAFVSEGQQSTDYVSAGMLRLGGLDRAFEEAGLGKPGLHMVVTSNDLTGGRRAAAQLLEQGTQVDAIVGHHDTLAAGTLLGLRDAQVEVPDRIAVIGYDGGPVAEALELTTVRQPFVETGRVAASVLRGLLADPERSVQHIVLKPELVVGRTS